MPEILIFAPSPVLTVTIEDQPDGAEVHLHAGGQGVWQARMLLRLGVDVTMCCVLTGESGRMLHHMLEDEGIHVVAVERAGRGGAYVHDRRGGERVKIAESGGEPISRHDLDELYGLTLGAGLGADLTILSGPASEDALPADVYRRLAADLRSGGRRVIVDLAGDRLASALAGGVELAKVSDEELLADGRIPATTTADIITAMRQLRREGADAVIITRSDEPSLVMTPDSVWEVTAPTLEVTDTAGAGDSLTAGIAAALAAGDDLRDAVALGAAAGALNVTRHGLGTGDPHTIAKLRELVKVHDIDEPVTSITQSISLDELAAKAREQ